jgi:phage shock protein A
MAGGRFGKLLKSSLGSLMTPAQDPRATFADPIQRQLALREQVQAASAGVQAARGRFEAQRTAAEASLPELESAARAALVAGRDDLARIALKRRHVLATSVDQLHRQIAALDGELHRLALIDQQITAQLNTFAAREQLAALRRSTAQAQIEIGEALSGVNGSPADVPGIEEIEREAEALESRAAAIDELMAAGVLGGSVWVTPAAPDTDGEIERQLAALRQEIGGGQGARPDGNGNG